MLRGIITGLFFGGVLGLMLAGVVSLLAPLPSDIEVPQAEAPVASQPSDATGTSLADTSATDAPVQADSVAQSPAEVEGVDGAPNADVASAPRPNTATVEDSPAAPAENGEIDVAVQSETPVLPNPQANAIASPGAEDEPSISVDPAQPQSPGAVETQAFDAPKTNGDSNAPVVTSDAAPTKVAPAQQEQAGDDALPSVDVSTADPVEPEAPEVEVAVVEDAPKTEPEEKVEEAVVSMLKPVEGFEKSFEQLKSNRLPTVSETEASVEVVEEVVEEPALPPLEAFAASFDPADDKPLMSVVLIDDPEAADVELSALTDFPLPLSIAVDATKEGSKARTEALRGAGLEVLAIVDLPAGATASDVEVNLAAQLGNVPQAVAVMDGLNGGIQETREIADQVISNILASGHGLVFQPKGLNTSQKLAAREGVGAVTVFRDFDGNGQSEVVIRRFMDQAAFKARQSEAVLMMGRLQSSTIAALASWALQDRASAVTVAPASALLRGVIE